jgi:hypothetical protein
MGLRDWFRPGCVSEDQLDVREESRRRSAKRRRDEARLTRTEEEQSILDSARDEYEALRASRRSS